VAIRWKYSGLNRLIRIAMLTEAIRDTIPVAKKPFPSFTAIGNFLENRNKLHKLNKLAIPPKKNH